MSGERDRFTGSYRKRRLRLSYVDDVIHKESSLCQKIWDGLELIPLCLLFLLVPVRLWKRCSSIYCFYNASKFYALINDPFTGSKSLPQSQTPPRDGEKEVENRRKMINQMLTPPRRS